MGPLKIEIMHRGPSSGNMGGIVGGLEGRIEIGNGGGGTQGVKGGGHLLGDVEDGADAATAEANPVAGIVLGANPEPGDDLNGAVSIGERGRGPVLVSAEEGDGSWAGGAREDEGEFFCVSAGAHEEANKGGGGRREEGGFVLLLCCIWLLLIPYLIVFDCACP